MAGVTSGGDNGTCGTTDRSYDTDVYVHRSFVTTAGGVDLTTRPCDPLAPALSGASPGYQAEDFLSSSQNDKAWYLDVPAGYIRMRVTLNGEEQSGNDFDLYVRRGERPTTSNYDCRGFRSGTFESCEFINPTPGRWFFKAEHYSGSGTYQLTTTLFQPAAIFSDGFESGDTSAWGR